MYGGNAQHQAQSASVASQPLQRILWSTPVDLVPPYRAGGTLLIHYGSPLLSGGNTVLLPVKTSSAGDFRVEARTAADGRLLWTLPTDYRLPASGWTPSMNIALDRNNRLYVPAAGGRLLWRDAVDAASGSAQSLAFYGNSVYAADPAAFDASVRINTPLTVDAQGTVFFGFIAAAGNPAGLASGIARVAADGSTSWAAARTLAGDPGVSKLAMNAAPALSADGSTLYIAVNNDAGNQTGYLLALDAATLATKAGQQLRTPLGQLARVSDSSTASPMVGPDGDVYYGVLDAALDAHNGRGWLLHFDASLGLGKTPGSFGWDDTPSLVPASCVPSYTGGSSYLLLVKYNNYYQIGSGDGRNRMAVLDPQAGQSDFILPAVTVMKEVLTVTGPTPDLDTPGGVREWCVNTAVVDAQTRSALVNNEDGRLYRWDFTSNTLVEPVKLNDGLGQAYTPTLMGPDGVVYSINNAQLHAVGRA